LFLFFSILINSYFALIMAHSVEQEGEYFYQIGSSRVCLSGSIQLSIGATLETLFKILEDVVPKPCEIVFNDRVCELGDVINPEDTSKHRPICFYHKYLKDEGQKATTRFFDERKIRYIQIIEDQRLQSSIDEITANEFVPDTQSIESTLKRTILKNEASKGVVVSATLREAFTNQDVLDAGLGVIEQFNIIGSDHKTRPDHALVMVIDKNEYPILFVEDKFSNMNQAIIQNFDQLRTYSFKSDEKFFYGLATNGMDYRFLCYVVPEGSNSVTAENFLISKKYSIKTQIQDPIGTSNSIRQVLCVIRGLLYKENANYIVSQR